MAGPARGGPAQLSRLAALRIRDGDDAVIAGSHVVDDANQAVRLAVEAREVERFLAFSEGFRGHGRP